jgi:hypothetical protein
VLNLSAAMAVPSLKPRPSEQAALTNLNVVDLMRPKVPSP